MKVLVTGGTGFVGRHLSRRLASEGHEVTVVTRGMHMEGALVKGARFLQGDPTQIGAWQEAVAGHNVLINLAGASIFGRWTPEQKKLLCESRTLTTRNLAEAIPRNRDTVLFSASAIGFYGFHGDEALDESSPPGDDFMAKLTRDWEAEAMKAQEKGARVIITRFGIVLGRDGGALQQMVTPFRWFVGGPIGRGRQWLSWIHMEDLVGAFFHLLAHPDLCGPINLTAPHPVQNSDFSRTLGGVLSRPSWIPAPGFMVRLLLGEFGSVILKGQRVIPMRLLDSGFSFQYPELEGALRNLLA